MRAMRASRDSRVFFLGYALQFSHWRRFIPAGHRQKRRCRLSGWLICTLPGSSRKDTLRLKAVFTKDWGRGPDFYSPYRSVSPTGFPWDSGTAPKASWAATAIRSSTRSPAARNEGIDARHNPEFTMLEVYQAYGNYETMMDLTEAMIVEAIGATGQGLKLPWGEREIDFTPPFARKTYDELFAEHAGVAADDAAAVARLAEQLGFNPAGKHPDVVKNFVFEERVEDALQGPIFVTRLSGQHLPVDQAQGERSGDRRTVRVVHPRHGSGQCLHRVERSRPAGRAVQRQLAGLPEEESMARWTTIFSAPCVTACRRPVGWASASIGW